MNIIGDIGNTEVKICLFSSNKKLIKKIYLKTNLINLSYLKKKLSKLIKKNVSINKIIFIDTFFLVKFDSFFLRYDKFIKLVFK